MRATLTTVVLAVAMMLLAVTATAKPPKGAVHGKFDKSVAAIVGDKNLVRLLTASNVYCYWSKGHVFIHISFRNHAVEHVTLTVEPRYTIRNGGQHGSGLTNWKSIGINASTFRAVFIDAGAPDGVPKNSPIGLCRPDLQNEKNG